MLQHELAPQAKPLVSGGAARKVKVTARKGKSLVEEVREVLADVVIAHVPVLRFNYRQKVTYLAVMLRRLMAAIQDPEMIDDRRADLPARPARLRCPIHVPSPERAAPGRAGASCKFSYRSRVSS